MKTNEIITGNTLIAEFMGLNEPYELPQFGTIRPNGYFKTTFSVDQLKYHSSWDWLMPVVDEIDRMGASLVIARMYCVIGYTDPLDQQKEFSIKIASGVKINAIHRAIIEFINWYNANYKITTE